LLARALRGRHHPASRSTLGLKGFKIPGDHEIFELWEENLAFEVHAILDQNNMDGSSTKMVKIGYVAIRTMRSSIAFSSIGSTSFESKLAPSLSTP
jgi:hypothetical protein